MPVYLPLHNDPFERGTKEDRENCDSMGGSIEPSGNCLIRTYGPSSIPECRKRCGSTATDQYGECYSFQKLEGGGYFQRYRFSSGCSQHFDAFKTCLTACDGASDWKDTSSNGAEGSYVAPPSKPILCNQSETKYACAQAGCAWEQRGGEVHDEEMCAMLGGVYEKSTCHSLPSCTPHFR